MQKIVKPRDQDWLLTSLFLKFILTFHFVNEQVKIYEIHEYQLHSKYSYSMFVSLSKVLMRLTLDFAEKQMKMPRLKLLFHHILWCVCILS